MKRAVSALAFALSLSALVTAHAAGTVQCRFVEPETFSDVRDAHWRLDANLLALERAVVAAASRYVPDGHTMTVEVTDVDLAGEVHPGGHAWPVRVMRGGADWPRIALRWRLDGPAPRSGQALVQDMEYQQRPPRLADGPLPYEQRMLQAYFRSELAPAAVP